MFHQTDWYFLAVRQDVGASNRVCNIVKIGCPLTFLLARNLFFIVPGGITCRRTKTLCDT